MLCLETPSVYKNDNGISKETTIEESSDEQYTSCYEDEDMVEFKLSGMDYLLQKNYRADKNYFSWDNIGEMADINSHIVYATTVIGKYRWAPDIKEVLERQLQQLANKQNDKKLNISVIGEFSTGKSSFINALVGYELLAVNAIQGTTVAITIIEYSDSFSITFIDFMGRETRKEYESIDVLREHLNEYTTNPYYSDKISYLNVTLPSDILKNGFRIIDTPGTNSLELWHEDITRRAITELSDLSIILVDATKPMPETLSLFIEESLGSSIKHCTFVANKIDLIKERERDGMIKYIETKVSHNFDIDNPLVLPFSSVALTNVFSKENIKVDNDSILITNNSLRDLLKYTAHNKVKAQAHKILQLIDRIFSSLNANIRHIADKYEKELSVLERSRQTDLKPFVQKQISIRQRGFIDNAKQLKFVIESDCDNRVNSSISNINQKIESHISLDNLSVYIKGKLSEDIKAEGENLSQVVESKYSEIETLYLKEMGTFHKEFKKEFNKLKLLSIEIDTKPKKIDIRKTSHTANISPVTTIISEELSKENWAFGGGAVAGAAIGTAIAPGIGTLIGAAIGFFAGGAAAPDINEVRTKIKSKLSIPLSSYYRALANDTVSNCNTYINDLNAGLDKEIHRYLDIYNSAIQERIRLWEERNREVKKKIKSTQEEIDRIHSHQHSIKNIICKL